MPLIANLNYRKENNMNTFVFAMVIFGLSISYSGGNVYAKESSNTPKIDITGRAQEKRISGTGTHDMRDITGRAQEKRISGTDRVQEDTNIPTPIDQQEINHNQNCCVARSCGC